MLVSLFQVKSNRLFTYPPPILNIVIYVTAKTLETNLYHTLDYSGPYNHDHQLPRRRQHLLHVGGLMDSLLTTLVQLALNLRDKF